jgi:hypothetical protein
MSTPVRSLHTPRRRGLRRAALAAAFVIALACSPEDRDFSDFDGGEAASGGTSGKGGKGGGGSGGTGGQSGQNGESGEAGTGGSSGSAGSKAGNGGSAGQTAGSSGSGGSGAGAGDTGDAGASLGGEGGRPTGAGGAAAGAGGEGNAGGSVGCSPSDPALDPDCDCVGGVVVAKDDDLDGEGSLACGDAPGTDCDDSDESFQQNVCGGCIETLSGTVGAACNGCGTFQCTSSNAITCTTPNPPPRRCLSTTTPELCVDTNWETQPVCGGTTPRCFQGGCVECTPGTFRCEVYAGTSDEIIWRCDATGYWESSWIASCYASSGFHCNATTGTCVTNLMHPRDANFEVIPALGLDPLEYRHGRSTEDVLDSATGFRFG